MSTHSWTSLKRGGEGYRQDKKCGGNCSYLGEYDTTPDAVAKQVRNLTLERGLIRTASRRNQECEELRCCHQFRRFGEIRRRISERAS